MRNCREQIYQAGVPADWFSFDSLQRHLGNNTWCLFWLWNFGRGPGPYEQPQYPEAAREAVKGVLHHMQAFSWRLAKVSRP